MKMKKEEIVTISVPAPRLMTAIMELHGLTSYRANVMREETKIQLREQTEGKPQEKRRNRNLEEEATRSYYHFPDGTPGVRAIAVKRSFVDSARLTSLNMVQARQLVFVQYHPDDPTHELLKLEMAEGGDVATWMTKRIEPVPNKKDGTPVMAAQMEFWPWKVVVPVNFNANLVSADNIVNLASLAGIHVGIGSNRVLGRDGGTGTNGMFEVKNVRLFDGLVHDLNKVPSNGKRSTAKA